MSIACVVCYTGRWHYGLGKHIYAWIMVPGAMVEAQKWTFALSLFVVSGVSAVKVSIGLLLVRLSDRTGYTRFIWAVISKPNILCLSDRLGSLTLEQTVFTGLFVVACLLSLILACIPVEANWDFSLREPPLGTGTAKCYSLNTFKNIGILNSCKQSPSTHPHFVLGA